MIMGHFEEDALIEVLAGWLPAAPVGARRRNGDGGPLKKIPLRAALTIGIVCLAVVGITAFQRGVQPGATTVAAPENADEVVIPTDTIVADTAPSPALPPRIAGTTVGRLRRTSARQQRTVSLATAAESRSETHSQTATGSNNDPTTAALPVADRRAVV